MQTEETDSSEPPASSSMGDIDERQIQEKPRTRVIRPEITRLPRMTASRRIFRRAARALARLVVALLTRCEVRGLEHFPKDGPALIVVNHLGDADSVIGMAFFPMRADAVSKADLYDFPLVGPFMDAYGVIWVHRGHPDRRALRAALQGLKEGRMVAIAPEGRESVTGELEEGTGGAAFLALRANVPVIPAVFTGTENDRIYGNLKRLRRTKISVTVGPMFTLGHLRGQKEAVEQGTSLIMLSLAKLLPPEYRGVYQVEIE